MRRIATAVIAFGLAACLPVLAQNVSTDPAKAPSGSYTIDAGHTQVLFSVLHLGLTDYFGRFDRISGTLNFDAARPEHSAVSITIDATSIDVPSARLTDELKAAPFDVQHYPTASFKSTAITRTGPDSGQMNGMLTIKKITRPVTLDVIFKGGENNAMGGGYALGFRATGSIKRSAFDLNSTIWSPYVSDDVNLIISAMFDQQKG
jgi:polyisoprenoid-binding protein YceI